MIKGQILLKKATFHPIKFFWEKRDAVVLASRSCFSLIIRSVATCLGARTVAAKALEWTRNHKVINHVCSDEEAVLACERFAGK